MRVALVVHGFPPHERTGVENYTAGLARALSARGHTVDVFAPRRVPRLPEHSLRREQRDGYAVTWVTLNREPDGPRTMLERPEVARSFGAFLEAERPDVVHFQHVVKLGLGLLLEAGRRGLPTLYTAHDYYAVCHRYTLLRPDLSHCDVRGDFMTCALCDASLGFLNAQPGLGDYQMGVLPDQLDEQARAGLAGLLEDDPEPAGWEPARLDAATDLRRELDSLRLQAFSRVDRVLAPTRFLADELARGGVPRERIEVLPYGIETRDLTGLPPVTGLAARPVRFAFVGGLSKHKGVHVLLDAFERLQRALGAESGTARAELSLWGYSTDRPYVERLRARAAEVGARWCGAYDRVDLPTVLAEVDVVVVPSIWVENQPLVIREAFAAGRPVLASDFGAMPESVRDGVDGLLFAVGDADALAAAMRRCVDEPGLVERLAAAIGPVHDADAQAAELERLYADVLARPEDDSVPSEAAPPASVRAFAERVRALEALPTRELYERVLEGLGRLRADLGAGDGEGERLLARALAGEPRTRALLRDARRAADWLRADGELRDQAHRAELDQKEAALAARVAEVDWLRREVAARDEHVAWLRAKHDELADDLAQLEELERELAKLPTEQAALDQLEARFETIRRDLRAIEGQAARASDLAHHLVTAQAALVAAELLPLQQELHVVAGTPLPEEGEDAAEALLTRVRSASAVGARLMQEVAWRREAMRSARDMVERRFAALVVGRTGLGREVLSWPVENGREPEGEA